MKGIFSVVLLFLVAATVAVAGTAKDVTSSEAKLIIDKTRNVYLLDVRTTEERRQGFIPGSVPIPLNTIAGRISEIPRNRPIIVYCAVGSRSRSVAQALASNGFPEVYNMRDGIFGWYRNGFPITQ